MKLFPDALAVEKVIVPSVAPVLEPRIVQFVILLKLASFVNLIVEVVKFKVLELEIVSALPPEFIPLILTKSAPFKSIIGAAKLPPMV